MPKLNCGVNNCAHNAESCCCLSNVKVDGSSNTDQSSGTCCNSFAEGGANNCTGTPEANSEINCEAMNCAHNEDCRCCADSIQVAGNGACNCGDTECSSFCKK
ncbi:MAG: DUF1540 domain-containing protein [Niameybacter sp.]